MTTSYYIQATNAPQKSSETRLEGVIVPVLLIGAAVVLINWWSNSFEHTYEDDLDVITSYANYNYWKKYAPWYVSYPVWLISNKKYDNDFSKSVINCYMNIILQNPDIPEYSAYSASIKAKVIARIKGILPYDQYDIERILNALHYAVADGSAKIKALLLPRTVKEKKEQLEEPEIVAKEVARYNEQRDKSMLEQASDLLSTFVNGALIIGGIAGLTFLITQFKSVTGKSS